MPPDSPLALSASARTRCLYSPVKMRRFALATTSGLGCPAMTPAASLRSALATAQKLFHILRREDRVVPFWENTFLADGELAEFRF